MGTERNPIELIHNVVHYEYDGYHSLNEPNTYYCRDCGVTQTEELHPVKYHNTLIDYPRDTPIIKCCLCNNPIAVITQLTDCRRCFLLYIIDETEQEFQRNHLLSRHHEQ